MKYEPWCTNCGRVEIHCRCMRPVLADGPPYRFTIVQVWGYMILGALVAALVLWLSIKDSFAGEAVGPRVGYEHFCQDHAELCSRQEPNAPAAIPRGLLLRVNALVNASITFQPDVGPDAWTIGPKRGDCDDYAVTKLALLIRDGIPRHALRLAIAYRGTVAHAVLLAETPTGLYVLDNLTPAVELVSERTDLHWFAVEAVSIYGYTAFYRWEP